MPTKKKILRSHKARSTSKDKEWTSEVRSVVNIGKYSKGKKTTKKKSRKN